MLFYLWSFTQDDLFFVFYFVNFGNKTFKKELEKCLFLVSVKKLTLTCQKTVRSIWGVISDSRINGPRCT